MKKYLVLGLGKSGKAAAALLAKEAEVSAWDSKPEDKFDTADIAALKEAGVRLFFGDFPEEHFDELVLSPGVPPEIAPVEKARAEGSVISGELQLAYEHAKGHFLAITGTNGKTTTTALLGEMEKAAGRKTEVVGNIGLPVTSVAEASDEDSWMVTEVSSFQLQTTSSFRPEISAILNITPDHMDRHHDMKEYARVKHLVHANQGKDGYFVFNADDPETLKSVEAMDIVPQLVPFSHSKTAEELDRISRGSRCYACVIDGNIFIVNHANASFICSKDSVRIPGTHNLENALAASAMAYFSGVGAVTIAKVLREFPGVEHRIEFIREYKGVRYVNDSKGTNPDSTVKAIEATKAPILLIAGGYDKGSSFDELMAHFDGKVQYLLLLGVTAPKVKAAALAAGFPADRIVDCRDLGECVEKGCELAEPGATVLLSPACASWDMYRSYEERGEHFRKLAESLGR